MKITAVICEYNPFHLGHAYQLAEIKKRDASAEDSAIIAIMSGSFTQRGTPAILSKYERAKIAVLCGADLVLELPFPFSAARADLFGAAGVKIANALGVVDELCFGSETGNIDALLQTNARISSEEYKNALAERLKKSRALSHHAAMAEVYAALYGKSEALAGSNDILALSYLAALSEEKSKIIPVTIRRVGETYNGEGAGFASATSIRGMLRSKDFESMKTAVPTETLNGLQKAAKTGEIADEERLFPLFAALARTRSELLLDIPDIPAELAARMIKAAKAAKNTEEFIALSQTKLYSPSRIRRGMLYAVLNVTEKDFERVLYTTVLAANEMGRKILSLIRKTSALPIVTKPADAADLGEDIAKAFALSAGADSIWELLLPIPASGERMMREHPRMLPT
jgi:predicted nucleotidyltransferase